MMNKGEKGISVLQLNVLHHKVTYVDFTPLCFSLGLTAIPAHRITQNTAAVCKVFYLLFFIFYFYRLNKKSITVWNLADIPRDKAFSKLDI